MFESLVNTEDCKTQQQRQRAYYSLRVLLIQKIVKLKEIKATTTECLRVLLIQKIVKRIEGFDTTFKRLRVLLIQKIVKLILA